MRQAREFEILAHNVRPLSGSTHRRASAVFYKFCFIMCANFRVDIPFITIWIWGEHRTGEENGYTRQQNEPKQSR